LVCHVNLKEHAIFDRNVHKPLFRWQEVINFENYEASLQTDDCFAIKFMNQPQSENIIVTSANKTLRDN